MKKILAGAALCMMFATPAFAEGETTQDPCGCFGTVNQQTQVGAFQIQGNLQISNENQLNQQTQAGFKQVQLNVQIKKPTYSYGSLSIYK